MLSTIEIFLTPICFAFLFFLMLLYWGQTALFSYIKYKKVTSFVFFLSLVCVTILLLLRWVDSGHLPLSNLYESLLFLSWSFLIIQAIFQISKISEDFLSSKTQVTNQLNTQFGTSSLTTDLKATKDQINVLTPLKAQNEKQEIIDLLAVILSPISLLTYTFAYLNLPKEMQKATALVPALQSNWLMMHVSVMILSYAALISGCILSITYLLLNVITSSTLSKITPILTSGSSVPDTGYPAKTREEKPTGDVLLMDSFWETQSLSQKDEPAIETAITVRERDGGYPPLTPTSGGTSGWSEREPKLALSEKLDNYSYRMIGIGFPLLTIGILSGAVWANSAWGSYWSWDPKETWALITWLFFAIYLHARITRGWSGKKAAIIATLAFFVVWFCFLGVNLLGTGLHSYGWFTK